MTTTTTTQNAEETALEERIAILEAAVPDLLRLAKRLEAIVIELDERESRRQAEVAG